MGLDNIIL